MGRVAEMVEEPGLTTLRADPLQLPRGPVPCPAGPEQDLPVAVGDGLVETVPIAVDSVFLDVPRVNAGPQPAIVAQRGGLVEDQLAGLGIVVASAERTVPLHEVRTIERSVIVTFAGLDDVLLPRVLGHRHYVIPGEVTARDSLGEIHDLLIGPSQLLEQDLVEVQRPGLCVLRDAPGIAFVLHGGPQRWHNAAELLVLWDVPIQRREKSRSRPGGA